jgi:hypothetical protein
LISIELGPEIYEWQGKDEILTEEYFKVKKTSPIYIKELTIDSKMKGIVLVGNIEVLVDTIIYTKSQGAFGDTIQFIGSNLVIAGLTLDDIQNFLNVVSLSSDESIRVENEASNIIKKVKMRLSDESATISVDSDSDPKYIIFGRKNFFLISSSKELVIIHKKQISVRKEDSSLVQIDEHNGITIVDKEKCLTIGRPGTKLNQLMLGKLGVNIASKVLENLIWE